MKNKLIQSFSFFVLLFSTAFLLSQAAHATETTGTWTKKFTKISGNWKIIEDADGAKLVLGSDFKTRNAPDLKFILSNTSVAEINNNNAMNDAVIISPLTSNKGEQIYTLPKNFKDFKTIALHCEKFSKLWGATDISTANK